jgi:hypothetical protein
MTLGNKAIGSSLVSAADESRLSILTMRPSAADGHWLRYEEINQHQFKMSCQPHRTNGSVSVCEKITCKEKQQMRCEKGHAAYQKKESLLLM